LKPLAVIWSYRWILVVGIVVCAGVTYGVRRSATNTYEASTLVQVTTSQQQSGAFLSEDVLLQLTDVYAELARSDRAGLLGITKDRLPVSLAQLKADVTVATDQPGVLRFTGQSTDPKKAAREANGVSDGFASLVALQQQATQQSRLAEAQSRTNDLQKRLSRQPQSSHIAATLQSQIQTLSTQIASILTAPSDSVSTIQRARPASSPVSPRPARDAVLAALFAALLLPSLAYVWFRFRGRFGSAEDAAAELKMPVLGELPHARRSTEVALEPLRVMRVAVATLVGHEGFEPSRDDAAIVVITSSEAGAGKTFVTSNLVRTAAADGRGIRAIDLDLRSPGLHERLGLPIAPGLRNVLSGELGLKDALQAMTGDAAGGEVLTAGVSDAGAPELVASPRLRNLLLEVADHDGLTIIDTPPVLPVSDPLIIARHATAVVLVINARTTRRREAHRAVAALRSVGAPVIGLVFNESSYRASDYDNGTYDSGHLAIAK
jgi:capsular exopolysaccharide synthesis family protein